MEENKQASQACKENLLALRDSLELLGGKWKLLIVLHLGEHASESHHFRKMLKTLVGISAKMLSKELKTLEENEIVVRTAQDTKPLTVTYALTTYGQSLVPIARTLQQWGLNHRKRVKQQ